MCSKIALFGPIASGKSTLLRRANKEISNCITIETDEITRDKTQQKLFAKAVLAQSYGAHLVMTAAELALNQA
jgi:dephospho-CoA kinase